MAKAPVLSVLNMKGGVGKTTLSAHLFRVLYRAKKLRVLLVDLDPQFNLSQCLLTEKEYEQCRKAEKTVLSAFEPPPSKNFFDIKVTTKAPPRADAISYRLKTQAKTAYLDLVVGNFKLIKYSLIDDSKRLASAMDYFKWFISQARDDYHLVVIDCNPSSSFITQCALNTCTHILSPVRPDKYSVLGVDLVSQLLDHIAPQPRPEQLILMNDVSRGSGQGSVESELRSSKFGADVLANRLHRSSLLKADPNYTGFATDKPVAHKNRLLKELENLSAEIAARLKL
jgi:chromosome partitioning protein